MTNEKTFDIIYESVWAKAHKDVKSAAMAQLVEHILGKDEVPGPNPGSSSRHPRCSQSIGALAFYRLFQKGVGMLYNNLSGYLKSKYGARVRKICIDGGFTCPNRDGKVGTGGCIYCSERGSGDHIRLGLGIREQVQSSLESAAKNDKFIAYFQNYTNTYAPVSILKERYDAALIDNRIVALAIGTRPDCINDEIALLIASYKEKVDVWVELGLQTASDEIAKIINRGYDSSVYLDAVRILKKYGIPVVTHIMIGLPGEEQAELEYTVKMLKEADPWGIKIHSVYVAAGTKLAKMYKDNEYEPISKETYIDRTVYVLTHINPDTVIHRLTGDCPRELLVAPLWNTEKNSVISGIVKKMEELGVKQGEYYTV